MYMPMQVAELVSRPLSDFSEAKELIKVVREAVREAINEDRVVRGLPPSSGLKVGMLAQGCTQVWSLAEGFGLHLRRRGLSDRAWWSGSYTRHEATDAAHATRAIQKDFLSPLHAALEAQYAYSSV